MYDTIAPAEGDGNALPAPDAPMVEWALWSARQGFRVMPVRAGAKHPPTIKEAFANATRDSAEIVRLWSRPGHAQDNPAIYLSDHIALDCDMRDSGGNETAWRESAKRLGLFKSALQSAMVVRTRRGRHVIWRRPNSVEIMSGNAVEPFIDLRALGAQGYLLAPGARVKYRGADGVERSHRYEVAKLPPIVGELPTRIAEALLARQQPKRQRCEPGAIAPGAEIDSAAALEQAGELAAGWDASTEGEGGHDNLRGLVMRIGDAGVSAGACADLLLAPDGWNDRCLPPWDPEALEYQVQTLYASRSMPIGCGQPGAEFVGVEIDAPSAGPAANVKGRRWFDSGDPYDLDEVPWLIDGMVPARGVGFLGGPSQSGKTFLVYALARCLASGEPFFGVRPDEKVSTFILQSESYLSGRKRLHAIDLQRGASAPLPVSVLDAGGIATQAEQRAIVTALATKVDDNLRKGRPRLGLIVVDTLSASGLIAEENSNDVIAQAIRFLQRLADTFECLVLVTHHPAKSANSGLRGGGAMLANVDVVIEITREGKAAVREVECVKQRDGEQRRWGYFTLPVIDIGKRRNGKPVTTCWVSMGEGASPVETKPLEGAERGAMGLLHEIYAEDQAKGAATYLDYWKRLCADDDRVTSADKTDSRRKAAQRAVDGLLKKGLVAKSGAGREQVVRPVDTIIMPPAFDRDA